MRHHTDTFADTDESVHDPIEWLHVGVRHQGDIERLARRGVSPAAFDDPDPEVRVWATTERDKVLRRRWRRTVAPVHGGSSEIGEESPVPPPS